MVSYPTLHDLLANDNESKALFNSLAPQAQVALQEQRQNIHTREDLQRFQQAFEKQQQSW